MLGRILNHPNLLLKDEDQLLNFVNFLYSQSHNFTSLYETVYFECVSSTSISKFISQFDMNCITNSIWRQLSMRLKQEIKVSLKNEISHKYIAFLPFTKDNEFNGIINYLKMKSDDNIDNEISLTFSTNDHENKDDNWTDILNILLYNDQSKEFFTKNYKDSWICFDFKDKTIFPTDYTVKTDVGQFLKSWFIEVSNDCKNWEIVDEKKIVKN